MKIAQEFDGETFTFRLGEAELKVPLAGHKSGAEIEKKALAWAREIDPKATLDD